MNSKGGDRDMGQREERDEREVINGQIAESVRGNKRKE